MVENHRDFHGNIQLIVFSMYVHLISDPPSLILRKFEIWLEYLEDELEAETLWFCSTREHFETCEYELRTPSPSTPTRYQIFSESKTGGTLIK